MAHPTAPAARRRWRKPERWRQSWRSEASGPSSSRDSGPPCRSRPAAIPTDASATGASKCGSGTARERERRERRESSTASADMAPHVRIVCSSEAGQAADQQLGARRDAVGRIDRLRVRVHRVPAQVQLEGDFLLARAAQKALEHVLLARRQPRPGSVASLLGLESYELLVEQLEQVLLLVAVRPVAHGAPQRERDDTPGAERAKGVNMIVEAADAVEDVEGLR